MFGTIYWQTAALFNNAIRNVCMRIGDNRLWIFITTKRLHLIRSITTLFHRFREQTSHVHSVDQFANVEFLFICWNAMDLPIRIVSIQVSGGDLEALN